jgi:hypothetical protein
MCFFEETTKVKFFKQKLGWLKKGFVEAIEEIENWPEIGYYKDINLEESSFDESKENKSAEIKVEIKDEPMEDGASGNANLEESILDESKESKSPEIKVEIKDEPEKGYPAWPQSLPLKKRKVADYGINTAIKKETLTTPVKIKSENNGIISNNSDDFSGADSEDNWKVQILPANEKEKPYSCKYCEKNFSHKHLVKQHLRIHTGEKPFACNYCEKRFTQSHSLQSHEYIHTGEKPYSCKICPYRCRNSANLKKHEAIHTGEKPFSCKTCSYQAGNLGNLKKHESIHTGEKLFSCMNCNKKFSTKQCLKTHEKSKMHQETEL